MRNPIPETASLEDFVIESVQRCVERKYIPSGYIDMEKKFGIVGAIERCVIPEHRQSGAKKNEPRSGFKRMVEIGIPEWSLEAAVVAYPERFSRLAVVYADAALVEL